MNEALLTAPHRSGLHSPPCELICPLLTPHWRYGTSLLHRSLRTTNEASRGKPLPNRPSQYDAESTLWNLDGYGLRILPLARPFRMPSYPVSVRRHIALLELPSDPASRQRPCSSLAFTSIRLAWGLSPHKSAGMPGTHRDREALAGFPSHTTTRTEPYVAVRFG